MADQMIFLSYIIQPKENPLKYFVTKLKQDYYQ